MSAGGRAQGAQANLTGKVLEDVVASVFSNHSFLNLDYAEYLASPDIETRDVLVRNVPYETIYGHSGKTEFLVVSPSRDMRFRIECKWQQSSGSVDEKFPYLIENCKTMPEDMIVILLDGRGYKDGALKWLRNAADACRANGVKDIRVLDMVEFVTWANVTF